MFLRKRDLRTSGGGAPAETLFRLYRLERACRAQLDAAAAGRPRVVPGEAVRWSGRDICRLCAREPASGIGAPAFASSMRRMDRPGPS